MDKARNDTEEFQEIDIVELLVDLPELGLRRGDRGTIVVILSERVVMVEMPGDSIEDLKDIDTQHLKRIWSVGDPQFDE